MSTITNPFSYYADGTTGQPLSNGFLYFGLPDTDPTVPANQVQLRRRSIASGNLVDIDQPARTNLAGVAITGVDDTPIVLDIAEFNYSVVFQNSEGSTVYSSPNVTSVFPPFATEAGKFLFTDGSTISWESVFPDQSGQNGNFLTTNGTTANWAQVLPPQDITDAGKFLTTDGTNTSWEIALPDQTGEANRYLTTDGTTASWQVFSTTPSVTLNQTVDPELQSSVTSVFPNSGRLLVQCFGAVNYSAIGQYTVTLTGVATPIVIQCFGNSGLGTIAYIAIGSPNTSETFTSTIANVVGAGFDVLYNIVQTQPA